MTFLIDGYNLLHAMGVIPKRAGPHGLEKARLRLLGLLQSVYGDESAAVTVVFDAARPPPGLPADDDAHGVRVRFAVRHEQADELIEDLIRHHPAPKQLVVVSDDRRIRQAARRRHCPVLSCLDYLDELQRKRRQPPPVEQGDEKRVAVSGDEVQAWLREFADVEDDPAFKELEYPYNLAEQEPPDE